MNRILQDTLAMIKAERGGSGSERFALVDKLLLEYGENNLAERLYNDIPPEWTWGIVADLFAILIWSTSDNGHALTNVTDQWLEQGDDLRKIQIALHLDTYPFLQRDKMNSVLSSLATRYPIVADRCNELILSRSESE
ncbi:MAG: hypothetical protein AB1757_20490 [Acidobacteriota bacterium]